jgi:protein-disulfide isomerase
MKSVGEFVVTSVLAACALVTTGVLLRREFISPSAPSTANNEPVYIKEWRANLGAGLRIGPTPARIDLIEFSDFECPFCGNFYRKLKTIRAKYPNQIGVTYVHYPLPMHRFAIPTARVAECSGDQGRFEAMHDQLFEGQDQFGLKPWDDYATAAGVPDMAAFDACIKKTDPIPRVEEGKALGAKLDVKGTPTIIINGWKLGRPPTEAELDQMVQRILAGKPPVDAKS